jgi:putative transposase
MKYSGSEKLEIIQLVAASALPVRRTLEKIGIPRATFYRWYDLYPAGGPEALDDRHPKPDRVPQLRSAARCGVRTRSDARHPP